MKNCFFNSPFYNILFIQNMSYDFQVLCGLLEYDVLSGSDLKMQVITTLQTTQEGKQMYAELCDRQIALRELVNNN